MLAGTASAAAAVSLRHSAYARASEWADFATLGPIECRADFSLAPYRPLFDELVALQRELIRTLAIETARQPVELYLFRNQASHRSFLAASFPRVPYRRALFVKTGDVGRVFAYQHSELAIDVRHECTHALLHASLPMVPLWLDEGLAEYFELPAADRAFNNPHLTSLRWNMRLGTVPPLHELETKADLAEMGGFEYRFAWAWAHFFLHGPVAAHTALVQFLADIHRGNPPGLLSSRLAHAVPDIDRRFVQHFKHWRARS